jgi:hypothetical protein
MNNLFLCTLILGSVGLITHVALLFCPKPLKAIIQRFPRNVWAGRILTVFALMWGAYETYYHMPLGGLEPYKRNLVWLVPTLIWLVCYYMDELLAPRALGALLMLFPAPLLRGVRLAMGSTPCAVIMSYVAYLMIFTGATLFLAPYLFRRVMNWLLARTALFLPLTVCGALLDVAFIVLAVVMYR